MQALEVEPSSPPVRKRHSFTSESARAALAKRYADAETRKSEHSAISANTEQLDTQYKFSKEDWAKLEQHLRVDIAEAIRTKSQKPSALRELVTCAGIAYDKAYKHLSEDIAQLRTPPIIIDRLMVMVSGDTANHVDVMPKPSENTEQSTPCTGTASEPS